ncbi:MAG: HD domain-containing protein [Bacilli bacterium]|nr:HD domain-containing protein [Bacilli bacterium]
MINKELKTYIENNILPLYQTLDYAHRGNHVFDVIKRALDIGRDYNVNLNMMYVISAFHDVGLIEERKTHHLIGAKMLREDPFIQKTFNASEIKIMSEAVEDHRASSISAPRSIYGMIISEADRAEPADIVVARALLYRFREGLTFENIYNDVYAHLIDKYSETGYIKVWLETKYMKAMQEELWSLMKDEKAFKAYALEIFNNLDRYK